ncbi:hypothetical protein MRX96_014263 [Rhipicephalus microplus]
MWSAQGARGKWRGGCSGGVREHAEEKVAEQRETVERESRSGERAGRPATKPKNLTRVSWEYGNIGRASFLCGAQLPSHFAVIAAGHRAARDDTEKKRTCARGANPPPLDKVATQLPCCAVKQTIHMPYAWSSQIMLSRAA